MTDQNMDDRTDMDEADIGGESARASDDSPMRSLKGFVKDHPLISAIAVFAILLLFGKTIMGVVGTALIIGGVSYLLAVVVYAAISRISEPRDDDDTDDNAETGPVADDDSGASDYMPVQLHDLIAAGNEDAKSIGEQYAIMLKTADENGGKAEIYKAKYSQTMSNVASVIAAEREMEAHPDRFDDVDEIREQYRKTISGVKDRIKSSIRALNTARTEKIKEDMDVIGKFNEKEL